MPPHILEVILINAASNAASAIRTITKTFLITRLGVTILGSTTSAILDDIALIDCISVVALCVTLVEFQLGSSQRT